MNVMGDVIFDTVKKGGRREGRSCWLCDVQRFFPELCSPSAGEQPALCTSSPLSGTLGLRLREKKGGGETTTKAWVVIFISLNQVSAKSVDVQNIFCCNFSQQMGLYRPICQRPITANSTSQTVLAAILKAFSRRWLAEEWIFCQNERGILVSFLGRAAYEVFEGDSLGSDIQPKLQKKKQTAREGKARQGFGGSGGVGSGGHRCLRVSRNMELLCINFLLSFWKVGSRLEAISRALSPHADVRAAGCNGLSVSDREGVRRVSAETALQGKGRGSERSLMEQIKNEKLWLRRSELLSDVELSNVE